jgi:hypothetical protein
VKAHLTFAVLKIRDRIITDQAMQRKRQQEVITMLLAFVSRSRCLSVVFAATITTLPGCFGFGADNALDEDDEDRRSAQNCSAPEDCPNIACLCDDGSSLGTPVNARHCTNSTCETAAQACPDACDTFGYDWTGSVVGDSGSGGDGGGRGGSGSGGAPGSTCNVSADCAAHTCSCPDGSVPEVRDCYDNVCFGADMCADQCCFLGRC